MGRVKEGRATFLGNAGEHYVVADLLRRDIIADRAPRNAPGIDVLATTGPHSVNVRVKTMSHEAGDWVWMAKDDGTVFPGLHLERDFVVLVGLAGGQAPEYWIVATSVLDNELRRLHDEWLETPGRAGRRHKNNPMRRIGRTERDKQWLAPYKGRWDLILAALGRANAPI